MRWRNRQRSAYGAKRSKYDWKSGTAGHLWYTWGAEFFTTVIVRKVGHVSVSSPMLNVSTPSLADIERLDEELKACFEQKLVVHPVAHTFPGQFSGKQRQADPSVVQV